MVLQGFKSLGYGVRIIEEDRNWCPYMNTGRGQRGGFAAHSRGGALDRGIPNVVCRF